MMIAAFAVLFLMHCAGIAAQVLIARALVAQVMRSQRATSTTIEHATEAAAARFDLAASRLPKTRSKRTSKGEQPETGGES